MPTPHTDPSLAAYPSASLDESGSQRGMLAISRPPAIPPSAEALLKALDDQQRAVAIAPPGPVCVLAGAGTGKTRAITHRIAYRVATGTAQAQRTLAVTFTSRAAGELRARLTQLGAVGVQARTFHSAALRQLSYFWPQVIGGQAPRVMEYKAQLVAEAARRLSVNLDRTGVRDLAAEIEWAKVSLITSAGYPKAAIAAGRGEVADLDVQTLARLLDLYEDVKNERGVIDFEDVLVLTAAVLEDQPDIAEQVRQQYRHFVVDEFQDVSPVQARLLKAWLGGRTDLTVVGDPAQTIYSFTGASADHLLGFTSHYPDAEVVELVRNYRSTPQIVHVANRLLAAAPPGQRGLHLKAVGEGGPVPQVQDFTDEEAEAEGIAEQINQLLQAGEQPADMAVLFRTNAQSAAIESALSQAGVPYLVRGADRFFSRPEVREAILLLRGQARAVDTGTTSGSPGVQVSAQSAQPGAPSVSSTTAPILEDMRGLLSDVGWSPKAPAAQGAARDKWESLQALIVFAESLVRQHPDMDLAGLVTELEARSQLEHAPTAGGVTLASLHSAKGLEWDHVFLSGLSEGLLPIAWAQGPAAVEEERRLAYVGLTRARRTLSLSWSRGRVGSTSGNRSPSRFLLDAFADSSITTSDAFQGGYRRAAITDGDALFREPKSRGTQSGKGGSSAGRSLPTKCAVCGKALDRGAATKVGICADCPVELDENLFARLKAWRKQRSEEERVPAFVLFTDATLKAIALRQPKSPEELLQISGIGAKKCEKYGDDVLDICAGPEQNPDQLKILE